MSYNPFTRQSDAQAIGRLNQNQSGSTIPKATPIQVTSSGVALIDVSQESDIDAFAGVVSDDSATNSTAKIVSSGTIENVTTSFAVGSIVYINKIGLLTNVKPTPGINGFGEGDFVIKIGMIAVNNTDNTKKDLVLLLQNMGQL